MGPYRQSDRVHIYKEYAEQLIQSGHAYKCFCSKERLLHLRETAMQLKPPTTVTYDRNCFRNPRADVTDYTIRFKAPDTYKSFTDLLHGSLNLQPQINNADRRFDDFVIVKSDGLPTYHFANVVDDHLMQITHVLRGEEWLSSTPKHVALYQAFGWTPPQFIHIPLLTSLQDRKLLKRLGDTGIDALKSKGILPEALTNFCALFGWAPPRPEKGKPTSEVMTLADLEKRFSLDFLTKGNAKVKDSKLYFFNKHHLSRRISDQTMLRKLVENNYEKFNGETGNRFSKEYFKKTLQAVGPSLTTVNDLTKAHAYLFGEIDSQQFKESSDPSYLPILRLLEEPPFAVEEVANANPHIEKKAIFKAARFALSGGVPGITLPVLCELIGEEETKRRIQNAIAYLSKLPL